MSESSFTCPGLRVKELARRRIRTLLLHLCKYTCVIFLNYPETFLLIYRDHHLAGCVCNCGRKSDNLDGLGCSADAKFNIPDDVSLFT